MKIDMHVHAADLGTLLNDHAGDTGSRRRLLRMKRWALDGRSLPVDGRDPNEQWAGLLAAWIDESSLDRVVLLAMDGVYGRDGEPQPRSTRLCVSNAFVERLVRGRAQFMYGASIHPYRKDALDELERVSEQGAVLVKWIPSGQRIDPGDSRCVPFYRALARLGIPLLAHCGPEHTVGQGRGYLNHPRRLVPALQAGVKVIAAHCGAHLFLHERSCFGAWAELAREYENLYGDLGAFAIVTRARYVTRVFGDDELCQRVLYGSDYPAIPSPRWCWQLGVAGMQKLSRLGNPLERNLEMMRALGMPDTVFANGLRVLAMQHGGVTA